MQKIFISLLLLLCFNASGQTGSVISLNGKWKLYYHPDDSAQPVTPDDLLSADWPFVSATVPGNTELDLLTAGLIRNPETGNNIYELRKYEAYCWWYAREFDSPPCKPGEKIDLVFDGIDCFGTIWLNNTLLGKTSDMFISHRFDISKLLNPNGKNALYVKIDPAVKEGQHILQGVIGSRMDNAAEFTGIRKAPHMYGWDIMPRLVSAGLWRDVHIYIIKPTHFEQVYWMTNSVDVPQKKAELVLDWQFSSDLQTIDGLTMEVSVEKDSKSIFRNSFPLYNTCSRKTIELNNVDFWWPRGYGEPALYDAALRITDKKGTILDQRKQRIGIRTADLIHSDITTPESPGEFVFVVNGVKIFARGTNWVPLDAFHSRDKDHLKDAIGMICDLNCNMIRCWGGNVYEDTKFFDLCDENGLMVWQDFAMACSVTPQSSEFAETMRKEAIQVVLKLRQHPSLVLWSGDNENDQSVKWTFRKLIDPNQNIITRKILPGVIWEFDPLRPYIPSSPYYSEEAFRRGTDDVLPEVHLWGPRGYYKAPFYTATNAHFVSEIGYHGCPNLSSLEKMFDPGFVYPWTKDGHWNDEWQTKAVRSHPESTATEFRNDLMIKQVYALFGDTIRDLDKFIFASQAVQAEAMKYFVELWRMDKFRKTGIIWWNFRDGWPIISDAVVDYYNSKKLAYYYIRQVQHNACVMIGDPVAGKDPVVAVNDTRTEKKGTVTVRDADNGTIMFSGSFTIPVNGKTVIGYIPESKDQAMWLIEYTIDNERYTNHYLAGTPPFRLADYQRWFKKLGIVRN